MGIHREKLNIAYLDDEFEISDELFSGKPAEEILREIRSKEKSTTVAFPIIENKQPTKINKRQKENSLPEIIYLPDLRTVREKNNSNTINVKKRQENLEKHLQDSKLLQELKDFSQNLGSTYSIEEVEKKVSSYQKKWLKKGWEKTLNSIENDNYFSMLKSSNRNEKGRGGKYGVNSFIAEYLITLHQRISSLKKKEENKLEKVIKKEIEEDNNPTKPQTVIDQLHQRVTSLVAEENKRRRVSTTYNSEIGYNAYSIAKRKITLKRKINYDEANQVCNELQRIQESGDIKEAIEKTLANTSIPRLSRRGLYKIFGLDKGEYITKREFFSELFGIGKDQYSWERK